jgi:hypothetical protein
MMTTLRKRNTNINFWDIVNFYKFIPMYFKISLNT